MPIPRGKPLSLCFLPDFSNGAVTSNIVAQDEEFTVQLCSARTERAASCGGGSSVMV